MTIPAPLQTIMIVEDDEHMMTLLQHLLEREGVTRLQPRMVGRHGVLSTLCRRLDWRSWM